MKNVLINVIATVFVFLVSASTLVSGEWIEKTIVDKEFKINSDASLVIDHEFGEIKCENWDKQAISVLAIVRVKDAGEEKAAKIIDKVIVDVKGTANKVEAVCELNQKFNNSKNIQVSIDLYIKMPKSINLELEHSFGAASIETIEGNAAISSEYGHIEISSLSGSSNEIEIGFGKGDIGYISIGEVEISYSGVEIAGGNTLSLETDYSDVEIGKLESLSAEIDGGHLEVGSIGSLELEASMTKVEIGSLSGSLLGETEYGGLEIGEVLKSFSRIEISNSYGSIVMNIDDEASYSLEAESNYGNIEYPEKKADISYRKESSGELRIKGVVGDKSKSNSTVLLTTDYGSIKIK